MSDNSTLPDACPALRQTRPAAYALKWGIHMKKIYRISLLLSLILAAAGMAVAAVGRCMGGREQMDELIGSLVKPRFYGSEGGEMVEFNGGYPVLGGDFTKELEDVQIHSLNASLTDADFRVLASDDEEARLESRHIQRLQCYVEDGCLYIRARTEADAEAGKGELTLYLPGEILLSDFFLEMGAGRLEVHGVKTHSLFSSLGAGEISVDGLEADEAEWNLGMGEIQISDSRMQEMYFHVGTGNLYYGGEISGNLAGDCSMGDISLALEEHREAYNYRINTDMGTIRVDGMDGKPGMLSLEQDNGADREIDLNCSIGNVEISFTNEN